RVTDLKCLVVRLLGQQAYDDSASYEEPPGFVKIFPTIDGTHQAFHNLYDQCPHVKLTIKSCCLIANLCLERGNQSNCPLELDECVQQAAVMHNTSKCYRAAKHIHGLLGR
ncbi:hypothetical protein ANCCAN_10138, partial [Ancylostoma caninum]